jgi:hypothetical protein
MREWVCAICYRIFASGELLRLHRAGEVARQGGEDSVPRLG